MKPYVFVSKKYPPTKDVCIESHFEHRNGDKIIYQRGSMPLGMGDWEEIGWCPHCACETATYRNGNFLHMRCPATFYELGGMDMHPCKSCAPKRAKILAVKAKITALNKEILSIAEEI